MKLSIALAVFLGGCTAVDVTGDPATEGGAVGDGTGGTGGTGSGAGSGSNQGSGQLPGQLTAGEWDDNLNFEVFQGALQNSFGDLVSVGQLQADDRIVLTVTDGGGHVISNARVDVIAGGNVLAAFPTATDGRIMLLPRVDGFTPAGVSLRITAPNGASVAVPARTATVHVAGATSGPATALDLAFVVDTTGSMGDELEYLKAEMLNIAQRASAANPNVSIRFALIAYRDVGDEYVTRIYDFTTDTASIDAHLKAQSAGGGGDTPESAEVAMQTAMTQLSWRTGNVARVLFHVADAPPHHPGWGTFLAQTTVARTRGIRIFPVAASGVDIEAEYLMRTAALVTLGRYVFLTDDSGIGNPHEIPHIPCFLVEHLNNLLVRTITSELAGHYIAPDPNDVIRMVGSWDHGTCTEEDARDRSTPAGITSVP